MSARAPAAGWHRDLAVPGLVALAAFAVLVGLGNWQMQRKAWKENLIATLDRRLAEPPVALPASQQWPTLARADWEFRRVVVPLEFLDRPHALAYTAGSTLRPDVKGPGFFVFAPARLAGGEIVAVNAGFVRDRDYPWSAGRAEVVGYLRWPEAPRWFVSEHDSSGAIWFVRDPQRMAKVRGWAGDVAPFYIDQEAPLPAGGVPLPGPLTVKLRNDHLGYAITWYGLAAALAIVFLVWARARRRERAAG